VQPTIAPMHLSSRPSAHSGPTSRSAPSYFSRPISYFLLLTSYFLLQSSLPSGVLPFQPLVERLEVFDHCLGIECAARGFLEYVPPAPARARGHECLQEISGGLAAEVVGVVRVLVEDLARDVIVELEQERLGKRVVVILRGVIGDMRLGEAVCELLAAGL